MAKLSPLTFRVSKLWGQSQGSTEKHTIDAKITYPDTEKLFFGSNFKADMMLIKLKEELSVILTNASIVVIFTCPLCLKKFEQTISIPSAEREFYYDQPREIEDKADLYLIHKKTMTIDLSEMVRQEILLHFPLISVCSKSCKGLCQKCGINKNRKKCKCIIEENDGSTYKPFQNLKNLMQ